MEWTELRIYTNHQGVEPLTDALISFGVTGFVINDPEDIKEFEKNKNSSWDYIGEEVWELCGNDTYITVYVSKDDPDGICAVKAAVKSISGCGDFGSLEISSSSIKEEDWANNWKEFFKPLEIGKCLLIKPSWEQVPENCERVVLELDPETSFGTGRHHTTRLCLELLEDCVEAGDSVCDIGCGSGIISIAAMLLGAECAAAVDISPEAAKIAENNAVKNGIPSGNYKTYCGDVITDESLLSEIGSDFDIVAANIVADVILPMCGVFSKITKKGGKLVISGIISERKDEVFGRILKSGFSLVTQKECEMWNAAVFVKE